MVANISKSGEEKPADTAQEPSQPGINTDPLAAANAPQPEEQKMEIDTTQNAVV